MIETLKLTTLLFLLISCGTTTERTDLLFDDIERIVSDKDAIVGVSIIANNGKDTVSLNEDKHFPMQSVFKFHIALAILSEIDEGKLSLDQEIVLSKRIFYLKIFGVRLETIIQMGEVLQLLN